MRNTYLQRSGALLLALAALATPVMADMPDALKPSADEVLVMVIAARGVQIYECRPKKDAATKHEWAFVAPEADLFDERGRPVGRHGAGPYWEANDGSRIVGTVKARADAPVAGAIPWLLLDTRRTGTEGLFSRVTGIQRVNTSGGVAPAAGCTRQTAGAVARVYYTADYNLLAGR